MAVVCLASCKKEKVDPQAPVIKWENNAKFATVELVSELAAPISIMAPDKIDALTISLGLGEYAPLANTYIKIAANKGNASTNPVFDIIDDSSTAALFQSLGFASGRDVRGAEEYAFDIVAVLKYLLVGQPVQNNTTFNLEIRVSDSNGKIAKKTASFHFTAAPDFVWPKNPTFDVVTLDENAKVDCKLVLTAPGKVAKLTVTLDPDASPWLAQFIRNRSGDGSLVLDLAGDSGIGKKFEGYFPSSDKVKGATEVKLDFGFMYTNLYDLSISLNIFTIEVEDANGKTAMAKVKFRKTGGAE